MGDNDLLYHRQIHHSALLPQGALGGVDGHLKLKEDWDGPVSSPVSPQKGLAVIVSWEGGVGTGVNWRSSQDLKREGDTGAT